MELAVTEADKTVALQRIMRPSIQYIRLRLSPKRVNFRDNGHDDDAAAGDDDESDGYDDDVRDYEADLVGLSCSSTCKVNCVEVTAEIRFD